MRVVVSIEEGNILHVVTASLEGTGVPSKLVDMCVLFTHIGCSVATREPTMSKIVIELLRLSTNLSVMAMHDALMILQLGDCYP